MTSGHRVSRVPRRGSYGAALVLVLAGLPVAANVNLARGTEAREPQDLEDLVQVESERAEEAAAAVAELQAEVDRLTDEQVDLAPGQSGRADALALAAGFVAVSGPGSAGRSIGGDRFLDPRAPRRTGAEVRPAARA